MPLGDWPIFTATAGPDQDRCAAKDLHYRQPRKHRPSLQTIATL